MNRNVQRNSRLGSAVRALVVLALFLPALGILEIAGPVRGGVHAHPLLVEMAATNPESKISIIVQKSTRGTSVEDLVRGMGGHVTADLYIINAFAADMTAEAAVRLSRGDGVRWVSLDAPVVNTDDDDDDDDFGGSACPAPLRKFDQLKSAYPGAVHATRVWRRNEYNQGQGIGVAVIDSGVANHPDLGGRLIAQVQFAGTNNSVTDVVGHGTHVAGIVAGNGTASNGRLIGVAPRANIISVKVSRDSGGAMTSNVLLGMQWILENKVQYNIRVVNMSFNSTIMQSYHVDPLAAASEVLWFNSIVVVVASGNEGRNALYPPANDPFVITVGALDERGSGGDDDDDDDRVASFSGSGMTGPYSKPEVVAAGVDIISALASPTSTFALEHPSHLVSGFTGAERYFRISGTSMSAPMVAGSVALLLADEPNLNPDQVKHRLMSTAREVEDAGTRDGEGVIDVDDAIRSSSMSHANANRPISQLLFSGDPGVNWNNVNWNNVNWNNVNWNNVNWNNVNWNNVNWNNVNWEHIAPCTGLRDVPSGSTFHPYVSCLANEGIIGGYTDCTFRPNNSMTRGQVAKMVSNASGFSDNVAGRQTYADMASSGTFWIWVERLTIHGVMSGYACGGVGEPCDAQNRPYFRPNADTTRGQLSKIVSNAAGYSNAPAGQQFQDVPTSHPFYAWIGRLSQRGVIGGYSCGGPGEACVPGINLPYFRPTNDVTRGQASKIVANTFRPSCPTP